MGEGLAPVFADGAVEIQTVHAAVERLVRLEIRNTVVKLRHFAARDVGRIGNDDIERPTPFGGGMVASALSTSTRFCTPRRWAFSRVSRSAPSDRSAASTLASSTSCAAAMPMQPEPQHRSRMRGEMRGFACSMVSSHSFSVSARGMSTDLSTRKVSP